MLIQNKVYLVFQGESGGSDESQRSDMSAVSDRLMVWAGSGFIHQRYFLHDILIYLVNLDYNIRVMFKSKPEGLACQDMLTVVPGKLGLNPWFIPR